MTYSRNEDSYLYVSDGGQIMLSVSLHIHIHSLTDRDDVSLGVFNGGQEEQQGKI